MLVLTRRIGESILIGPTGESPPFLLHKTNCALITVSSIDEQSVDLVFAFPIESYDVNRTVALRKNESFHIARYDARITVVDLKLADGPRVRLGIVAPREMSVLREEVYDLMRRTSGDDNA